MHHGGLRANLQGLGAASTCYVCKTMIGCMEAAGMFGQFWLRTVTLYSNSSCMYGDRCAFADPEEDATDGFFVAVFQRKCT